jgi:hypothetical protein
MIRATEEQKDPIAEYTIRLHVIQGLMRGFAKVKHHEKYTKRVASAFEAELPGYTVRINPAKRTFDSDEITVWGRDITYQNAVRLSWHNSLDGKPQTWQEGFQRDLKRADPSHHIENLRKEVELHPALNGVDRKIRDLMAKAHALQVEAYEAVRRITDDAPTWELKQQYPLVFSREFEVKE